MSEYQYYEFQALDRPLTELEMKKIAGLSSRVHLSTRRAIFTYSYSDLPVDPLELLHDHFDALLYLANWGSRQLVFRFPRAAVDTTEWQPYLFSTDAIEIMEDTDYTVISIDARETEYAGWIEGDGLLDALVPLREALMQGDTRLLYLAWLADAQNLGERGSEQGELDGDDFEELYDDEARADRQEPPVPPALGSLSRGLLSFCELFDIDLDLVSAAATASAAAPVPNESIGQSVSLLSREERTEWLNRLVNDEPALRLKLLQRLRDAAGQTPQPDRTAPRRTIEQLVQQATGIKEARRLEERHAAEAAKRARLMALAQRADELWGDVEVLIETKRANSYDEAVRHLADLRDLAALQAREDLFRERVTRLVGLHASKSSFIKRLRQAGLLD